MKKLNHNGFSAVEALLIFVIIVIIGFAGWFVWHSRNSANSSYKNTGNSNIYSTSKKATTKTVMDPTADWITYSSKEGKFSLKYPKTWVTAASPENCASGMILIAPNQTSVGHCGSEGFGEVAIFSSDGDIRSNYELKDADGYTDIVKEDAIVSGVNGKKESAVVKGQTEGLGQLADGTILVQYVFYTNNKTYVAVYTKTSSYPDALSDFNTIITKTLKFE